MKRIEQDDDFIMYDSVGINWLLLFSLCMDGFLSMLPPVPRVMFHDHRGNVLIRSQHHQHLLTLEIYNITSNQQSQHIHNHQKGKKLYRVFYFPKHITRAFD